MLRLLAVVAVLALAGCGAVVGAPVRVSVPVPRPVPAPPPRTLPLGVESIYALFDEGDQADADRMLRDVWSISRYRPVRLPTRLTWREDPFHDQYWRFVFYSLRPLSDLLWAHYRLGAPGGDDRYRDKLVQIIRSFCDYDEHRRDPSPRGIDYPHAVAFRAMALTNIYVKLARSHELPADLRTAIPKALARAGRALADPANYEGHDNHGFSEAAALLLLQRVFPALSPNGEWGRLATARLTRFMTRIVDPDGVEIEKSPFYHFYVLDFALALQAWGRRSRTPLSPGFDGRVTAMLRYATDVVWPDGSIPLLGSSVRLRPERSLDLYADLDVEHPEFAYMLATGAAGRPPAQRAVLFGRSGQAVLRAVPQPRDKARLRSQVLIDAGRPQTAHSHRAALALLYYSHGRELLPDSGLYTYAPGLDADFFHNASAHNTVIVDGAPNRSGPIRPGRTLTGPQWAYQSGFAAVYPGVTHRRSVLLLQQDLVLVVDRLTSAVPHRYAQLWHLFPTARVLPGTALTSVFDSEDEPVLAIAQAGDATAVSDTIGARSPMQGWYSAEYGKAVPNHVIGYTARARTTTFVTLLASGRYAEHPPKVSAQIRNDVVRADLCGARVTISRVAEPGERVTVRGACDAG